MPAHAGEGDILPTSWDGTHLWADFQGGIAEIARSTGKIIKTIKVLGDGPSSDGTHVWVVNYDPFTSYVFEIQIRKR